MLLFGNQVAFTCLKMPICLLEKTDGTKFIWTLRCADCIQRTTSSHIQRLPVLCFSQAVFLLTLSRPLPTLGLQGKWRWLSWLSTPLREGWHTLLVSWHSHIAADNDQLAIVTTRCLGDKLRLGYGEAAEKKDWKPWLFSVLVPSFGRKNQIYAWEHLCSMVTVV